MPVVSIKQKQMTESIISLGGFVLLRLKVYIRAITRIHLPSSRGAVFRGALGSAFSSIVCRNTSASCSDCGDKKVCLFDRYFERKEEAGRPAPLRPYVLEPPPGFEETIQDGEEFSLGVTLIGESINHLGLFLSALDKMCRTGIGEGRHRCLGQCRLERVLVHKQEGLVPLLSESASVNLPNSGLVQRWYKIRSNGEDIQQIRLHFLSPTTIKRNNKIIEDFFPFNILVLRLLERISILDRLYCGDTLNINREDFEQAALAKVSVVREMSEGGWVEVRTRSRSDQGMPVNIGGLVGHIVYKGEIGPFLNILRLGEHIHVGKKPQ